MTSKQEQDLLDMMREISNSLLKMANCIDRMDDMVAEIAGSLVPEDEDEPA